MRYVATLLFSFAALGAALPAAAHGAGFTALPHPPAGCYPWSGCRK